MIAQLHDRGIWDDSFYPLVEKLYEINSTMKLCNDSIKKEGLNIYSERGSRKNPAIDLLPVCWREFRTICSLLKLSPKDSGLEPGEEKDEFEDI